MSVLEAGSPVPEFVLRREDGSRFTQEDLAGKTTVLVFFPFAFSSVCTDQLNIYEEVLDDLRSQGASALYGVSCDSTVVLQAFREKLGISIELLSDWEPKGATCTSFGVLHPGGFPQRALVIAAPDGTIQWSYEADSPGDLPGANLIFDGLAAR